MGVADQRFRTGRGPFNRPVQAHCRPGAHGVLGDRREHLVTAILDPADRAFDLHRHPGDVDLFGQQHAFIPEPAADIGCHHAERGGRFVENFGIGRAVLMGALARHIDRPVLLRRPVFG